jgi:hypothetical protein
MRVPYMVGLARRPQPALCGSLARPRPMMPVPFAHQGGILSRTSVLDTGADDTVVPDWIAAAIGLDLTVPVLGDQGAFGRSRADQRMLMEIETGLRSILADSTPEIAPGSLNGALASPPAFPGSTTPVGVSVTSFSPRPFGWNVTEVDADGSGLPSASRK